MTAARYALGLAALTVTVGSALWSAVQVRRRALPTWSGAVARLAEAVVALAEVIAVEEALGAVGLFRRGTVLVTIVVAALTLGLLCRRGLERRVPPPRLREEHGERRTSAPVGATAAVAAAAAAAAVTLVACQWGLRTLDVLQHGMSNVDSLWFHLPFAAQAVQHGWLTHPHFTDVDPLTTYLPSTPELFHGLGMLAFGRDSLSPLLNALWLPPTLLAAWCVGARRGLGHLSLVGGALLLASPLLVTTQPGQATTDTAALFFLLAAFAFLLNGAWETSAVVLAAVATGLAVSSKLSLLAPAAALSLGVVLLNRRRRPALALAWVLPLAVSGGYWYARNLAVTGNPLPWLKLGIGDLRTPSPDFPVTRSMQFSVAHYLTDTRVVTHVFRPGLARAFGPLWVLIVLVPVAGLVLVVLRASSPLERMLGAVGLLSAVAYIVTPTGAGGPRGHPLLFLYNLRYLTPTLVSGLVLLPGVGWLGTPRGRRGTLVTLAGLLIASETTSGPVSAWPVAHRLLSVAGSAALALVVGGAVLLSRHPWDWSAWRKRQLGAMFVSLVVVVALAGDWAQVRWARGRYQGTAPVYTWARAAHQTRIALAGSYLSYPLYGSDLSNRVEFVGVRLPHGGFRPTRSCREWRQALLAGRYRYVVVVPRDGVTSPPEAAWTSTDPAAHPLVEAATSEVFRLDGAVRPDAC